MLRHWLIGVAFAAAITVAFCAAALSPRHPFSGALSTVHFLAPLAAMVCGALLWVLASIPSRRRLSAQLEKMIGEAKDLERFSSAILSLTTGNALFSSDTQQALGEIMRVGAASLNVDRAAAWLFNEQRGEAVCRQLYRQSTGTFSAGDGIKLDPKRRCFNAMKSKRVLVAEDAAKDEVLEEIRPLLLARNIGALMESAIYMDGRMIGFLTFSHLGAPRRWSASEQHFASSLADLTAAILEVENRKRVEEELKMKSKAIEASVDGIAIVNGSGAITYANKALTAMYGFPSRDELIGKSWRMLYDAKQLTLFDRYAMPTFRTAGKLQIEAVGRRQDGTFFPQELSLTSLEHDKFICVMRNISSRKESEQRLIESQRLLRTVIDTDPNFIFVKDAHSRFVLVNKAVAEAYGTTAEKLVGKTDSDFNSEEDEVRHFKSDDRLVIETGKRMFIPEERITIANKEVRWLQTVKLPLKVPGSPRVHVLGVSTDITERRELQAQLAQSQKMDALGQLAGGIAHDFNNMMTGILGYATLLKMSNHNPASVQHTAELIESAAVRASELTQKLLGFARRGKHQNTRTNLHHAVEETLAILNRTVEKNIQIQLDLGAHNPHVMGDPTQLQQVLLNLTLNARDSMNPELGGTNGGMMVIETKNLTSENLLPSSDENAPWVEISVKDTGCGIPEEHLERVFDPFFTTKQEGRGTGMGLAMVYGIVKNHNGVVQVESAVGAGSVFKLRLPTSDAPLPAEVKREVEPPRPGRGSILLVDDHQIVRDVAAEMLQTLGYKVVSAADGVEALQIFEHHRDEFDLVVLDMVMPRMSGKECLLKLKRIDPNVKVLLSTGYGHNHSVQELLAHGVLDYLPKPYTLSALSQVIARALATPPALHEAKAALAVRAHTADILT